MKHDERSEEDAEIWRELKGAEPPVQSKTSRMLRARKKGYSAGINCYEIERSSILGRRVMTRKGHKVKRSFALEEIEDPEGRIYPSRARTGG